MQQIKSPSMIYKIIIIYLKVDKIDFSQTYLPKIGVIGLISSDRYTSWVQAY
jgi:hypothetical protein